MDELAYESFIRGQWAMAQYHLSRILLDQRKLYWPRPIDDPIWVEEQRDRVRANISMLDATQAFYSEIYGDWKLH